MEADGRVIQGDRRAAGESPVVADGTSVVQDAHRYSPLREWIGGAVALEVDRAVFSLDALLCSAYKFSSRAHVFIQQHPDRTDRWLAVIRPKGTDERPELLASDFSNDLIDQQLRARLNDQFASLRTLIAAQAFSEGNLLDPQRENADDVSDPYQIGTPR